MAMPLLLSSLLGASLLCSTWAISWLTFLQIRPEAEREKALARQRFSKNFRDLQVISQQLLREHEGRRLTTSQLAKQTKSINKSAKTLHSLMALGELAQHPDEVDEELTTAAEFDQSIRRLASLIYEFSHSPHHQNTKVFDTVEATKVQKGLLTIIFLAKIIESQAKSYVRPTLVNPVRTRSPKSN